MKKGNQLVTDLYVKPTDTIIISMLVCVTFLIAESHYLSVKLCILTEFVLKTFFDKQFNELELWLKEDYSDKLVKGQIHKARKFSRSEVLKSV